MFSSVVSVSAMKTAAKRLNDCSEPDANWPNHQSSAAVYILIAIDYAFEWIQTLSKPASPSPTRMYDSMHDVQSYKLLSIICLCTFLSSILAVEQFSHEAFVQCHCVCICIWEQAMITVAECYREPNRHLSSCVCKIQTSCLEIENVYNEMEYIHWQISNATCYGIRVDCIWNIYAS